MCKFHRFKHWSNIGNKITWLFFEKVHIFFYYDPPFQKEENIVIFLRVSIFWQDIFFLKKRKYDIKIKLHYLVFQFIAFTIFSSHKDNE